MLNSLLFLGLPLFIPLPPLDDSKILLGFTPPSVQNFLYRFERYGLLIIITLQYLGILNPVIRFFAWVVLSVIKVLVP